MFILGALVVLLAVAMGFFAQANSGTIDVTLFGNHWTTYTWVPVAIAAGAGTALFLLGTLWLSIRVRSLRRVSAALQHDVDLLKLERATAAEAARQLAETPPASSAVDGPAAYDARVAHHALPAQREPVHAGVIRSVPQSRQQSTIAPPWPSPSPTSAAEHTLSGRPAGFIPPPPRG